MSQPPSSAGQPIGESPQPASPAAPGPLAGVPAGQTLPSPRPAVPVSGQPFPPHPAQPYGAVQPHAAVQPYGAAQPHATVQPYGAVRPVPGGPYPGHPRAGAWPSTPVWPPPGIATNGQRLAEAGDRLVARILDSLVLFLPNLMAFFLPIALAVGLVAVSTGAPDESNALVWVLAALVGLVVSLALSVLVSYWYGVVYEVRHGGQTLGKRWRRIRVVDLDGGPLTVAAARRRWAAYEGASWLSLIPLVGSLITIYVYVDALWLLWDKPNRQCLHDRYARTVVVVAPDTAAPATPTSGPTGGTLTPVNPDGPAGASA